MYCHISSLFLLAVSVPWYGSDQDPTSILEKFYTGSLSSIPPLLQLKNIYIHTFLLLLFTPKKSLRIMTIIITIKLWARLMTMMTPLISSIRLIVPGILSHSHVLSPIYIFFSRRVAVHHPLVVLEYYDFICIFSPSVHIGPIYYLNKRVNINEKKNNSPNKKFAEDTARLQKKMYIQEE